MSALKRTLIAALGGAAMLVLSMAPASAFSLAGPSLAQPGSTSQIEKVWWHRWGWGPGPGWGYRPWGYGWGYRGWGGPHCWRGYWGHLHCNY
jgi:hypothetical protein